MRLPGIWYIITSSCSGFCNTAGTQVLPIWLARTHFYYYYHIDNSDQNAASLTLAKVMVYITLRMLITILSREMRWDFWNDAWLFSITLVLGDKLVCRETYRWYVTFIERSAWFCLQVFVRKWHKFIRSFPIIFSEDRLYKDSYCIPLLFASWFDWLILTKW